ncbi:hypothetical protein [Bradyrhizobium sp. CSA207]|uniref:hypothetical protein n=1 Tax=Bradyrhizobium sp. CSA207 TaxID=2698826 RepID=UPI0023B06369|nr:hypothetical protein [Bradyrhizobium sp. CSA207]
MFGSSVLFDMVSSSVLGWIEGASQVPCRNLQKSIGLAFVLAFGAPVTASAVTVEVARACDAALAKAFPPKQIGNPAAGSKGTPKERRDYFSKCVANNGKVDDAPADTPKDSKANK